MGIGLYIVISVVEAKMNGKISVQNTNVGACFEIGNHVHRNNG